MEINFANFDINTPLSSSDDPYRSLLGRNSINLSDEQIGRKFSEQFAKAGVNAQIQSGTVVGNGNSFAPALNTVSSETVSQVASFSSISFEVPVFEEADQEPIMRSIRKPASASFNEWETNFAATATLADNFPAVEAAIARYSVSNDEIGSQKEELSPDFDPTGVQETSTSLLANVATQASIGENVTRNSDNPFPTNYLLQPNLALEQIEEKQLSATTSEEHGEKLDFTRTENRNEVKTDLSNILALDILKQTTRKPLGRDGMLTDTAEDVSSVGKLPTDLTTVEALRDAPVKNLVSISLEENEKQIDGRAINQNVSLQNDAKLLTDIPTEAANKPKESLDRAVYNASVEDPVSAHLNRSRKLEINAQPDETEVRSSGLEENKKQIDGRAINQNVSPQKDAKLLTDIPTEAANKPKESLDRTVYNASVEDPVSAHLSRSRKLEINVQPDETKVRDNGLEENKTPVPKEKDAPAIKTDKLIAETFQQKEERTVSLPKDGSFGNRDQSTRLADLPGVRPAAFAERTDAGQLPKNTVSKTDLVQIVAPESLPKDLSAATNFGGVNGSGKENRTVFKPTSVQESKIETGSEDQDGQVDSLQGSNRRPMESTASIFSLGANILGHEPKLQDSFPLRLANKTEMYRPVVTEQQEFDIYDSRKVGEEQKTTELDITAGVTDKSAPNSSPVSFLNSVVTPMVQRPVSFDWNRPEFAERFAAEIKDLTVNGDLKKFEINPRNLGRLEVALVARGTSETIRIEAESQAARDVIVQHAQAIQDMLKGQGRSDLTIRVDVKDTGLSNAFDNDSRNLAQQDGAGTREDRPDSRSKGGSALPQEIRTESENARDEDRYA
ncbi:MAG: hypothetical protein Pars2KO_00320 [Parasphingorhabdus sp.]